MASVLADIAAAVVTELSLGAFSQDITAVRSYRPAVELAELKTLHVTVVPKATMREMAGRNVSEHETQIDVAVQKRVDPSDVEECDEMDLLCEEIADWFDRKILTGNLAICKQVERKPIFDPKHLEEKRVFTGVITLTFSHSS
jgi:hypothetical protein